MCNFNIVCQVRDGTCDCGKAKVFPEIVKPVPVLYSPSLDPNLLSSLFRLIAQQNEMIRQIAEQSKFALEKLTTLSNNSVQSHSATSATSEEVTTSNQLQKFICGEEINHTYSLSVVSDIPSPAYKERAFSLMLQIVDVNGNKAVLPESVNFKIMLFTTESPPKLMKINTSGDKIMKGTVEVQGNSTLFFRKIAIKEVSSHFRNGCFFFVVSSKEATNIKPLIIDNFIVKARKINNDSAPRKKVKTDDADSISTRE